MAGPDTALYGSDDRSMWEEELWDGMAVELDDNEADISIARQQALLEDDLEPWRAQRFARPVSVSLRKTTLGNVRRHRPRITDLRKEEVPRIKLGTTRTAQHGVNALCVFQMIWQGVIVSHICAVTNEQRRLDGTVVHRARGRRNGQATAMEEVEFFHLCGVMLAVGLVGMRCEKDCWRVTGRRRDRECDTAMLLAAVQQCMSLDRFMELCACMSINDRACAPHSKNPHRVDWLLEAVFANSASLYTPAKQLSLDDQSVPFAGRSFLVQGPRARKAAKYAIPCMSLNAANGFTIGLALDVPLTWSPEDEGEGQGQPRHSPRTVAPTDVRPRNDKILGFLKDVLADPRGFEVYMDRAFASEELFDELAKLGVVGTGTVKANMLVHRRSAEQESARRVKQLAKGMFFGFVENAQLLRELRHGLRISCSLWLSLDEIRADYVQGKRRIDHAAVRDRSLFHIISTSCAGADCVISTRYSRAHHGRVLKWVPAATVDYQRYKGGVDKSTQWMEWLDLFERDARWTFRLFRAVLALSVFNSIRIMEAQSECEIKLRRKFVTELALSLCRL